jgi:hypothetical protein
MTGDFKPAVEALIKFKGFRLVAAMITVSELGAYLGLVSSEYFTTQNYQGLTPFERNYG